jgi:hypothetical protein
MQTDQRKLEQFRTQVTEPKRTVFSRDFNYLRDVVLFWPFCLFSIYAVLGTYSAPHRQLGLRCAVIAVVALLLAKEKALLALAAVGFVAVQCTLAFILHPRNWILLVAAALSAGILFAAYHYWKNPRPTYDLPDEFGAVDLLLSFVSICLAIFIAFLMSPQS